MEQPLNNIIQLGGIFTTSRKCPFHLSEKLISNGSKNLQLNWDKYPKNSIFQMKECKQGCKLFLGYDSKLIEKLDAEHFLEVEDLNLQAYCNGILPYYGNLLIINEHTILPLFIVPATKRYKFALAYIKHH